MLNNKFVLFFIISLLYGQEFEPETGALIKKNFDPKTGELIKEGGTVEKSETKLKSSDNTIKNEEKEVENAPTSLKINKVKNIKENSFSEIEFDKIYFEETMYPQSGFWSSVYVKNGRKISKVKYYKELENYRDSRTLYDEAQLRFIYGLLGAGLVVVSPFLGASTENFMVFFTAYLGGLFSITYNTLVYSNLMKKSVWIFNREAIKANLDNKQK